MLNSVANHPDVRSALGGDGSLELAAIVDNVANFALVCDGGGFVLIAHEPGVYEVHSLFLPEARVQTVAAMQEGFEYMFTRTDCYRILTMVPDDNRPAMALASRGGFRPLFRGNGPLGAATYMAMDVDDWAQKAGYLEEYGHWFHGELEDAKEAMGSSLPTHEDDPAHERAVGATVLMLAAGNTDKGVVFYNRWARFAGYAPLSIFSYQPAVVDVVDAVVEIANQEMRVLLCR